MISRLLIAALSLALVGAAPFAPASSTVEIEVTTVDVSDDGPCCQGACTGEKAGLPYNKYFSIADDSGPWYALPALPSPRPFAKGTARLCVPSTLPFTTRPAHLYYLSRSPRFSCVPSSAPGLTGRLCGETCIRDPFYPIFHLFEKNLTITTDDSVCADAGYTKCVNAPRCFFLSRPFAA